MGKKGKFWHIAIISTFSLYPFKTISSIKTKVIEKKPAMKDNGINSENVSQKKNQIPIWQKTDELHIKKDGSEPRKVPILKLNAILSQMENGNLQNLKFHWIFETSANAAEIC